MYVSLSIVTNLSFQYKGQIANDQKSRTLHAPNISCSTVTLHIFIRKSCRKINGILTPHLIV